MGSTWSSGSFLSSHFSSASTSQLQVKDVLALCEDGDLLLAREKLADSALRVGVDFVVARDIQHMQRGQFPSQRVTSLPRTWFTVPCGLRRWWCWFIEANSLCPARFAHQRGPGETELLQLDVNGLTHVPCVDASCELLLRHEGALRVVTVSANGFELVPFEERVASKLPHIHDRFAIRRLRYDARSESLSSTLRDLALQIASVAPISWHSLLFPDAGMNKSPRSPRSPRQQPVDRDAVANALKILPPLLRQLLRRSLELLCQGLKLDDDQTASLRSDSKDTEPTANKKLDASTAENQAADKFRCALETLGVAEFTARLGAAFVAAVYEHVNLLDPIGSVSEPVVPAAFWSGSNDNIRITLNPPTALGLEMALTILPR